jgi:hypothetical protein
MQRTFLLGLFAVSSLTGAVTTFAQEVAVNAISIGGGVHPLGSAGPIVQYEYLRGDALAIGGRYLQLSYTYDDDAYHETGDGKGIELFAHYHFRRQGYQGPYLGAALGYFDVDWDWRDPGSRPTYGSGSSKGLEVAARFGWRFPVASNFFIDPALVVGNFFSSAKDDTGEKNNNLGFYGALVVNVGFTF